MDAEAKALKQLRRICLQWPETLETTTFGHPTFRAGKKTLAVLETYRDELSIAFPAGAMQPVLLQDPRFYRTPYVGHRGWVSLRVSGITQWDEVEALLLQSYRAVAQKRMLKALNTAES